MVEYGFLSLLKVKIVYDAKTVRRLEGVPGELLGKGVEIVTGP